MEILKTFPDNSVDCIVTSPPYFGLRSYLPNNHPDKPKEIGYENTLNIYLDKMILIMTELKRIMKPTATLFWNHGDSYDSKSLSFQNYRLIIKACDELGFVARDTLIWVKKLWIANSDSCIGNAMPSSFKSRLANSFEPVFMLVKSDTPSYYYNTKTGLMQRVEPLGRRGVEERDWEYQECSACSNPKARYYRDKNKSGENCIRCGNIGKAKESFWRSVDYWFDIDALRVSYAENSFVRIKYPLIRHKGDDNNLLSIFDEDVKLDKNIETILFQEKDLLGANRPNCWQINAENFSESHYAVFPQRLIFELIRVGCPQEVCRYCGLPRTRLSKTEQVVVKQYQDKGKAKEVFEANDSRNVLPRTRTGLDTRAIHQTVGWSDCNCEDKNKYRPGIVLDPFMGAGTTGLVAKKLGRNYIGIELNKEYVKLAEKRIEDSCGSLFDSLFENEIIME